MAMPYKDPAKRREYHRAYEGKHREAINAYQRKWRQNHLEEKRAKERAYYQAHKEELVAKVREFRARKKAEKDEFAASVAAESEERNDEMGLKTKKCPLCKSAASAKLKGVVYLAGCLNKKCRKWIDGDESETGATMGGAIGNWNKWVDEELERQDAENDPPQDGPDDDWVNLGEVPVDESPKDESEPDDPEAPDGEESGGEEGDGEEAGEDDGETFARFWLELDGTWYWLEGREDEDSPCEGCAFCLAFGRRTFCAAESSEDFSEASELCKRLEGVWKKNEE